uniref:Uncharacterized protein n=1 Tax=Picea glauca TaxID=3330 RepID=A0A124GNA2_PICGL|nr:hypothetical protein ABT39_MTgene5198 [Picea glauca]QHR91177.1 hypothetical protein Q903MT_gene5209 [Picea sitchensis]
MGREKNPHDGVMGKIVGCHLLYPPYPWPHESLPLRKSPRGPPSGYA